MIQKIKTYRLVLIFCLILIIIVISTSVNKVHNHKASVLDKNKMTTTINEAEEPTQQDTSYYNQDAVSDHAEGVYSGYYDTHPTIDRGVFLDDNVSLADDTEYVEEQLNTEPITEDDFKQIIEFIQSSEGRESYQGYRITDSMQEKIKSGELRVKGYEDITQNYISIDMLGIADDGEFIGKITFKVPTEQTLNIEGFVVNGQVDSMQIF